MEKVNVDNMEKVNVDNMEKVNMIEYPEGFNEALKALDFLPEDDETRAGFLTVIVNILAGAFF